MKKGALAIGAAMALVALVVAGSRYTRQVGVSLTRGSPGAARTRATVRFVKNPQPVTPFTVQDLDGRLISSRTWRGKVTIVNFWATWCPPCRAEIPDLIALQTKFGDRLQIIGVSLDETSPDAVRQFARQQGMNYPVVMVTDDLRRTFPGVFALPTSFVIDLKGRTVQKHVGLISPAVYEQETRVLSGLDEDVTVEEVDDTGQVLLANAALATEIPGLALDGLTPAHKHIVLARLNAESCTCGCGLTLAQCRINDPDCQISLPIARRIVEEVAGKSGS